jgi:hypothetical protein
VSPKTKTHSLDQTAVFESLYMRNGPPVGQFEKSVNGKVASAYHSPICGAALTGRLIFGTFGDLAEVIKDAKFHNPSVEVFLFDMLP